MFSFQLFLCLPLHLATSKYPAGLSLTGCHSGWRGQTTVVFSSSLLLSGAAVVLQVWQPGCLICICGSGYLSVLVKEQIYIYICGPGYISVLVKEQIRLTTTDYCFMHCWVDFVLQCTVLEVSVSILKRQFVQAGISRQSWQQEAWDWNSIHHWERTLIILRQMYSRKGKMQAAERASSPPIGFIACLHLFKLQ